MPSSYPAARAPDRARALVVAALCAFVISCVHAPPAGVGPDLAAADLRAAKDPPATDGAVQDAVAAPPDTAAPPDGPFACETAKLRFKQKDGCANDGSVEFCLPASDAALIARVRQIAPRVTCAVGGGRARCDRATELLCTVPTGPAECESQHGALREAAWRMLCELSQLSEIREIVHTIFE